MGKGKNHRKNHKKYKNPKIIQTIEDSRSGGAIALDGYDYQCLISCYVLLKFSENYDTQIKLEAIEDLDVYEFSNQSEINHIQVKKSQNRQDASFMSSILKNYLEIYLNDKENENRFFTLAYDFEVAQGALTKLIANKINETERKYWDKTISKIRTENPRWDWDGFVVTKFLQQLKFKKIEQDNLSIEIEKLLIANFDISSGNEKLYARSLYYYCFLKMKNREAITAQELKVYLLGVKDEINKGSTNPAGNWLNEINFNVDFETNSTDFYEGKKAEYSDIVSGFPVRRLSQEQEIEKSLSQNTITIIKSSSGQGKTTLAWQVAYNLNDSYTTYQLTWCKDEKEINNIVEFIKSRIKVGIKPLILIDNLDAPLKSWGILAQQLYQSVGVGYKLLVTVREDDWYLYSGDQSKLRSMRIITIKMDQEQAEQLYSELKVNNKLHPTITNWQSSWEKISTQGLLIEYVYLLTHGEMLQSRLQSQMAMIEKQTNGSLKYDILRKICFADVLGIPLPTNKIGNLVSNVNNFDTNQLLTSIENEYFIKYTDDKKYITGLHPVRSQHILDLIHQTVPYEQTILDLLKVVDIEFSAKLYSQIPIYITDDKEEFFSDLVNATTNKSYEYYVQAIQGLFSGSVFLNYYLSQKPVFDDIAKRAGLIPCLVELNPYSKLDKFSIEVNPVSKLYKISPENENIAYLKNVLSTIQPFDINNSDYYVYAYYLFDQLKIQSLRLNKSYLAELVYWLVNINESFFLIDELKFTQIWNDRSKWGISELTEIMTGWYLHDEDSYLSFINQNKDAIIFYFQVATKTLIIDEQEDNTIHLEYLADSTSSEDLNLQSYDKLEFLGRLLPIYDRYSAKAIQPKIDILEMFNCHDESIKNPSKEDLFLRYRAKFNQLWIKTIQANYEAKTTYDWLNYWFELRKNIMLFNSTVIKLIEDCIQKQKLSNNLLKKLDELTVKILSDIGVDYYFPSEDRPFEKKNELVQEFSSKGRKYFDSMRNYINQVVDLIQRDEKKSNLPLINLRMANIELAPMQNSLMLIYKELDYWTDDLQKFMDEEKSILNRLLNTNFYYLSSTQLRIANKRVIEDWSQGRVSGLIKDIHEHIILNIQNLGVCPKQTFDIVLPNNVIDTGALYELPLVIKEMDITDDISMGIIIHTLLGLTNFNIDNTTVMFEATNGKLNYAMKIYNHKLDGLDVEKMTTDNFKNLNWFIPWQVKSDYLNYFDDDFKIEDPSETAESYVKLVHKLWECSRVFEYLDDGIYRQSLVDEINEEIKILLINIENDEQLLKHSKHYVEKTLSGNYNFSDKDLNKCYEMIS